jgi:hypothetical protein
MQPPSSVRHSVRVSFIRCPQSRNVGRPAPLLVEISEELDCVVRHQFNTRLVDPVTVRRLIENALSLILPITPSHSNMPPTFHTARLTLFAKASQPKIHPSWMPCLKVGASAVLKTTREFGLRSLSRETTAADGQFPIMMSGRRTKPRFQLPGCAP